MLAESDRDYVSFHSRHSAKIQEFNDDKNKCLPVDPWNQCIDQVVFTLFFWGFHPMTLLKNTPIASMVRNYSMSVKFPTKKTHGFVSGPSEKKVVSLLRSAACDLGWPGRLVNVEHGHSNSGFTYEKWWFSIVMLVYHRNSGFGGFTQL